MANTLTALVPKLLAQGLLALRENAIMPALVNRGFESMAGEKGSTIDVPVPSAIAVQDVTPANTPPSTADIAPTTTPIVLDQWKEAPFYMTDKDRLEVEDGIFPMQASEAIKALANVIDQHILGKYVTVSGLTGSQGTTPFAADTSDATSTRKVLNDQLAPLGDRRFVIDTAAEANALDLRAFQDMSFSGDPRGILEGQINRKLGFDWFMDQNVPTHVHGTSDDAYLVNTASAAIGDTTVVVDTGTGTYKAGDIVTFAGDTQNYAISADYAGGAGTISIHPALKAAPADDAVITDVVTADHVVNLAFHRDAFAFASRPLEQVSDANLGSVFASAVDPVSGLVLRLEVTREHKRQRFSYDILYGAALVRHELAARLAG